MDTLQDKVRYFMKVPEEDPLVKRELFAVSLRRERKKALLCHKRKEIARNLCLPISGESWSEKARLIEQLMVKISETPNLEEVVKLKQATASVFTFQKEEDHL